MRKITNTIAALALLIVTTLSAFAQSSINPAVPVQNAPLASAPVRNNFANAYSDINGLLLMHQVSLVANCSVQSQTVGADCLVLSSPTSYLWYKYTGPNGFALVATINPSTSPPTVALALPSIGANNLLANCTGAPAIPTGCTWNTFANAAISSSNGALPYHTGGSWGTISTGTSGGTIPLNNTANVFSAVQAVNLNVTALTTPQTGTLLQLQQANSSIGRIEIDVYANTAVITAVRADGTAASPTTLVANDEILSINGWGYDGTSVNTSGAARFSIFAGGTWSNTSHPAYLDFATTNAASLTLTSRFQIGVDGGLFATTASGGSQGNGTLNLLGLLYNNGVAPTGTGGYVLATSPTLVTPNIGVASGSSLLLTGASLPATSAGNTAIGGTQVGSPSLSGNGQVSIFSLSANGAIFQGIGSVNDVALMNKSGGVALAVPTGTTNITVAGSATLTVTSVNALCVGQSGCTNPALSVDDSTASSVTGLNIKSAASGNGVTLSVISSATNETLTITAKGPTGNVTVLSPLLLGGSGVNGSLNFQNTTSGNIAIAPPAGALGSVTQTLQDVTDTFVYRATTDTLSNKTLASPVITGAFTATGLVTNADLVNASVTVNGTSCTLGASCTPPAPAGTLTGSTLAAGVTTSSLTSLGTITSLTATTINAFTLGGTISGGGNQINNVVIGASTPLAGSFTTVTASTSITNPLDIGGSGTTGTQKTFKTTTGNGTTDAFAFVGGNNGATTFGTLAATGLSGLASIGVSSASSVTATFSSTQSTSYGQFIGSGGSFLLGMSSATAFMQGAGGVTLMQFQVSGGAPTMAIQGGSFLALGTGGVGYLAGSGVGGAVTQATSRTTGVTLNTPTGAITLFTAAGVVTATTFTVTNSTVAATDIIKISQKSGTNLYEIFVTAVAAGSFNVTFLTTGGVASDAPVFNFAVIKGSAN